MLVYVTVGSTGFDALVSAVCRKDFFQSLADRGFRKLAVQYGSSDGVFELPKTASELFGVSVEGFDYTRWPQRYVEQADLIICHAGTGSILEALHAGKPAIAVPNHELMDGHQSEICQELAAAEYLLVSEPGQLVDAIDSGRYLELVPYPHADPRPIGEILDEESSRKK
ncbi:N-acetylglucosaminyldiphosphodolichol N-acetylglucosaminyltransferase catalytic subunit alg13 [Coemansia sp. RSA 2599]|nr:N-acetylglucosaminyldiphosphodolichol N-acetylglucosaminyltransferase catalytic subunit alg13 [Coemansia sp. RSA 2599]